MEIGRERLRTSDPLNPIEVRYQPFENEFSASDRVYHSGDEGIAQIAAKQTHSFSSHTIRQPL